MPSVTSVLGLLEKVESSHLSVSQNRCILVRNRNVKCMKCAYSCTTGCISVEDNQLVVSPEKCIGCGTCANVCPSGALEVKDPSDMGLCKQCVAVARQTDGEAVIACNQILDAASGLYDPEKVVGVACLGRVDESLVMSLAATGDVSKVTLVRAKCEECDHACGARIAEMACDTANVLLEVWGSPVRAAVASKLPSKIRLNRAIEYDHRRREFFSDLKDGAKTASVISTDYAIKEALGVEERETPRYAKVDARGVLPQEFPARRKRLLNALDELGDPGDVELTTRLWGTVDIDMERCSSCRMCATFCPTGAIFKFSTKKGKIGVKHRPRQCVNCGSCEAVCRKGALSLSSTVSSADIMSADASRFVMPPLDNPPGKPQSILRSMKKIINCNQMYDR